jgi:subtilisin family serine protease
MRRAHSRWSIFIVFHQRNVAMAAKKMQYVMLPSEGTEVEQANVHQAKFFQALHVASSTGKSHSLPTEAGKVNLTVLDSIGEDKAKLVEISPDELAAFRSVHPSVRMLPIVYYAPAVMRYEVEAPVAAKKSQATAKKVSAKPGKKAAGTPAAAAGITVTVTSAADGSVVAGAMVVAFTDFANKAGAEGTTNAKGQVTLALGAASKSVERVYIYPKRGFWPALEMKVTLKAGTKLALRAIDTSYVDCVRHFYGSVAPNQGKGVTVGVIDSGVAIDHPDLTVSGGQNTVKGERPTDFGDNGGEGHGTHVAGIIAAHGTPPIGIRGVAPAVTLRSYRVFGKKADGASNFAIAKAIDAAVADKCDLLNMSLGGGDDDTVTAEAIVAAYKAGVVVFAATGNDGRQPVSYPAADDMCQAVSAMGRKGTFPPKSEPAGSVAAPYGKDKKNFMADFSNIGSDTDLVGPGVGVISTVPSGYGVMSGTSMATPAQTGAAARLLSTMPAVLGMKRDQQRSAAMLAAIAKACKPFGFGANFEGKGMITP